MSFHQAHRGPDKTEHRWTAWRKVIPHFDSMGGEIRGIPLVIIEVSGTGTPTTPGFSRHCPCGAVEGS